MHALATRERVPLRIAKGELEGKMKARIWRKLHAEEARRFDQAYALVAKHPDLSMADAFAVLQSGATVEELRGRRSRAQKRTEVLTARQAVDPSAIDTLYERWRVGQEELSVVLGERTLMDTLVEVRPVAISLARSGRVEKLSVVLVAARAVWEPRLATVTRDTRIAQRPVPVSREPERRPFSDPRLFEAHVGKEVVLSLRNGMVLEGTLHAVGPFDLLLGGEKAELLVPIHALLRFDHDVQGN